MAVNLIEVSANGSRTVRFTWPTNTRENDAGFQSSPDIPQGVAAKAASSSWEADLANGNTRTIIAHSDGSARRYSNDWMTRAMTATAGGNP